MRIKKLTAICEKLKKNYDPSYPTANDDRETFTQLDSNLISLQMKVKVWEMNQRMYIPVECQQYSKGSKLNLLKKKNPAVEEKSSNKASSEAEPTVGQTEAFPAPPTEV